MSKTIIGLFEKITDAQEAIAELHTHGFAEPQISIVTHPSVQNYVDRSPHLPGTHTEPHTLKTVGAGTCAAVGTLAGGTAGVLATLGLMAFPGHHLDILAAGPIIALLVGGGAGAAAGGLVGALLGLGASAHAAEALQAGVQRGGALLTVTADDDQSEHVVSILTAHHATNVERCATPCETADTSSTPTTRPIQSNRPVERFTPTRANPSFDSSIYSNPDRCTSARIYNPDPPVTSHN